MSTLDSPASVRDALRTIAGNFWFSWLPGARALFEDLDPERFEALDHNPTRARRRALRRGAGGPCHAGVRRTPPAGPRDDRGRGAALDLVGTKRGGRPVRRGLLLLRVRARREPADLLGRPRRTGRRPPEVGVRSRRAARRHRALLPRGLLPPGARRDRLADRALSARTTRRGFRSSSSRSPRSSTWPTARARSCP